MKKDVGLFKESTAIRTASGELELWRKAAKIRGMGRSAYIRQVVNEHAKRTIEAAKK